jgi:hypothetical protein
MSYRFRLGGQGLRHSWEKECPLQDALVHATEVAGECARDRLYDGASIAVTDDAGKEIAVVPVVRPPERKR